MLDVYHDRVEPMGIRRAGSPRGPCGATGRVVFALVANRAIAPGSKLAAAEWASHDVAIARVDRVTDDQAYRSMDLLVDADVAGGVQRAVFFTAERIC